MYVLIPYTLSDELGYSYPGMVLAIGAESPVQACQAVRDALMDDSVNFSGMVDPIWGYAREWACEPSQVDTNAAAKIASDCAEADCSLGDCESSHIARIDLGDMTRGIAFSTEQEALAYCDEVAHIASPVRIDVG